VSDGHTAAIVLVVANETLAGGELAAAVEARAARGPIRAVVVAPVNEPGAGYVVYDDTRRAAAGRRLDRLVAELLSAGIPAHGGVFEGGPLAAVKDVIALEHVDELIVSTHPEAKSGWLRRDLLTEIRKAADPSSTSSRTWRATPAPPTSSSSRTRPCSASRCSTGSAPVPPRARPAS
jgi:hypothetical protein